MRPNEVLHALIDFFLELLRHIILLYGLSINVGAVELSEGLFESFIFASLQIVRRLLQVIVPNCLTSKLVSHVFSNLGPLYLSKCGQGHEGDFGDGLAL